MKITAIISVIFILCFASISLSAQENHAPVAVDDSYSTTQGINIDVNEDNGLLMNDSDAEGDTLKLIKVSDVEFGTLLLTNGGRVVYVPAEDFVGTDSFTYKISDGSSESNIAIVSLTVQPKPVANNMIADGSVYPEFSWVPPTNSPTPADFYYNLVVVDQSDAVVVDTWVPINNCDQDFCSFTADANILPFGLSNGTYNWYLRTVEDNTYSVWSAANSFTVNVPAPAAPVISAGVEANRPYVSFTDDPNVTWVQVYISGENFTKWYEKSAAVCDGVTCTLSPDLALADGDYEAYVQVWGPGGLSTSSVDGWAGPAAFHVGAIAPSSPAPISASAANGSLTLTWQASTNAEYYEIWVGSADYSQTLLTGWYEAAPICGETCTLSLPSTFEAGTTYTWFIRSWGQGGYSIGGTDGWVSGSVFSING